MAAVATEQCIPFDKIRQIKEKGLRKLRTGRAEIQAEYEERKKQIEAMFEQRERKCL